MHSIANGQHFGHAFFYPESKGHQNAGHKS